MCNHNHTEDIEDFTLYSRHDLLLHLDPALTQEGAKARAEWFMTRMTYGVKAIYATTAKRINLTSWEVEVVVIKSS